MDAEPPPEEHEPPVPGHGLVVGLSALTTTLTWVIPTLALAWFVAFMAVSRFSGTELTRLDDLKASLFDNGCKFALIGVGAVLFHSAWDAVSNWFRAASDAADGDITTTFWWPAWRSFVVVCVLAVIASVLVDHFGVLEPVEPVGWLALFFWTLLVLPVWFAWLTVRCLAWSWRKGVSSDAYRGGLIVAAVLGVASWGWTVASAPVGQAAIGVEVEPKVPEVDRWAESLKTRFERGQRWAARRHIRFGVVRSWLAAMGGANENAKAPVPMAIPPRSAKRRQKKNRFGGGGIGPTSPMGECMEYVAEPPPVPSLLVEGVQYLQRRGRTQDAEDIAQETVIRVCGKQPHLRGERMRQYFYKALKNGAADGGRAAVRRQSCSLVLRRRAARHTRRDPWEVGGEYDAMDVRRALCQLSTHELRVIDLRYRKGYSHREGARLMGMRTAAFRQQCHRVAKKVRRLLGGGE